MTTHQTSSSERLGLPAAPAGLCLVQDLLNTAGVPGTPVVDLLDDEVAAQGWLDTSLRTWAEQSAQTTPVISIAEADLAALRASRDHVRGWLSGADDEVEQPLTARMSSHEGRLTYRPQGRGAGAVASLVHLELLLASHAGTLTRLKLCLNPACGAAFYDLSRNSARVWHDMKTCGNAINLRASRARRRETVEPDARQTH